MALLELPLNHGLGRLKTTLEYVKNFHTAIDGGAHQGIWTKYLQTKFKEVYAFEPEPRNYSILETVADNPINMALGNKGGWIKLLPGPENTGQYYIDPEYNKGEIEMAPLDLWGFDSVGFIKLDVEGYELFVLQGAIETIMNSKPVILFEDNGLSEKYNVKLGDAGKFLESLGYKFIRKMGKDYLYCI